ICRGSVARIVPSTIGSVYSLPVRLSMTVRSSDGTAATVLGGVDSLRGVEPLSLLGLVRGHVRGAALADHRHPDLARVLEVVLDLACDLVREQDGCVVVDLGRLDEHPDLAAGLQRVDLLDAWMGRRELLEGLEALHIVLETLAAGTRPRPRD